MVSAGVLRGRRSCVAAATVSVARFAGRLLIGIAKPFNIMSIAGALRSANAEEMRVCCPAGEDNWKSRLTFCEVLSTATERTAKSDLPSGLGATIEPMLNNILDAAACERSTLSIQACRLLGNMPTLLGRDLHTHIDRILPVLIRHTASTKAVAQKSASAAVSSIIFNTPYNARFLYHVCQAFDEKYTAPKLYAPGWLKLIIDNYYGALNPDRDYDTIAKAINTGLVDADNNVRVNSRATFWAYHKIDPTGADHIIENLHAAAKTALMNDPNNPEKITVKSKKPQAALAQIKQQKKEQLKQKTMERNRVVSAKTITSEDFATGPLEIDDKKTDAIEIVTKNPKKTGSADNLRNNQSKKPTPVVAESSTARPLLSAPVRRPRIIATPINIPQSSSRPASRAGQPAVHAANAKLRSTVSHKELRTNDDIVPELKNITNKPTKITRSELSSPVLVPEGKENTHIYKMRKQPDPNAPDRLTIKDPKYVPPYTEIKVEDDGLTREHRLLRGKLDQEILDMAPQVPLMAACWEIQDVEKHNQMYHTYPDLNHDGYIDEARTAFVKALEYLQKDALDRMGFRKLRKLLEQFGRSLITEQEQYDQLFNALLPRLGTFEELVAQPIHEIEHESHPRYIRQAVLTMISILIHDYPFEWSYQFQGPALAAAMIARCAYSVNCEYHEGAPYVHHQSIVNQINVNIQIVIESCLNPVQTLDSVLEVLSACETFLMRCAPHDSEETPQSWASFNPYSKINRLRLEDTIGPFDLHPKSFEACEGIEPKPLPLKLPQLMETGLQIIKKLIMKAAAEDYVLSQEREDVLADLARHLMNSYSVVIRREVMDFCQVLYRSYASKERFWIHFQSDSEKNLLHYFLEKVR